MGLGKEPILYTSRHSLGVLRKATILWSNPVWEPQDRCFSKAILEWASVHQKGEVSESCGPMQQPTQHLLFTASPSSLFHSPWFLTSTPWDCLPDKLPAHKSLSQALLLGRTQWRYIFVWMERLWECCHITQTLGLVWRKLILSYSAYKCDLGHFTYFSVKQGQQACQVDWKLGTWLVLCNWQLSIISPWRWPLPIWVLIEYNLFWVTKL